MNCIRFLISGKVQGVGFRYATQDVAKGLNLTGYAKNLPEGTVEVKVCGKDKDLELFENWLENKGPPYAKITEVKKELKSLEQSPTVFEIY